MQKVIFAIQNIDVDSNPERLLTINYFRKRLHLRYLTGFWVRLCNIWHYKSLKSCPASNINWLNTHCIPGNKEGHLLPITLSFAFIVSRSAIIVLCRDCMSSADDFLLGLPLQITESVDHCFMIEDIKSSVNSLLLFVYKILGSPKWEKQYWQSWSAT